MRRSSPLTIVFTVLLIAIIACDAGGILPTSVPTNTPAPTVAPRVPVNPIVADTFPARGDELKVDDTLFVYFDQAMDRPSVEAAFSIDPKVNGVFSWKDDSTLTFKPSDPLQRSSRYRVSINAGAKNKNGLALQNTYTFNADTVGFLEVAQVLPAPNTNDVESKAAITLMFNRPVVPLGISGSANFPSPVTFEPPIKGAGEWLNTSIYIFRPDALAGGVKYTARVKAGLADVTGGVLKEDYAWSFTTQPPKVIKVTPTSGARDIILRPPITVTFSQAMDVASVQRAFALTDLGGRLIPGDFKWDAASTVMTFTPSSNMQLATTHKVKITNEAKGADGNTPLAAAQEWQFTTVLAPAVVSTRPADKGDVDPFGGFRIEFASPMDRATLEKNVTIIPEAKTTYTSYSGKSFYLGFQFKPSTDYTVTIGGDMADVYGNKIGKTTTIKIKTRGYEPYYALNTRGDVGLYSAYTSTVLYATYRNYTNLRYRLYKMPVEEFAQYTGQNGFNYRQNYKPKELLRDWKLTPKDFVNENAFAKVFLEAKEKALDPGIYYLESDGPNGKLQHVLIVSRINLTIKTTFKEVLVWATDLQSGKPLANVPIVIRNAAFASVMNGVTDENGLYRGALPTHLADLFQDIYVTTDNKAETFSIGQSEWSDGVDPWDFNLTSSFYPKTDEVYLYTDRPVYRPGQIVYFKGVVRNENDARFTNPDIKDLRVFISNDEGNSVYTDTVKVSSFGTFNGQFTLAESAGTGFYNLQVKSSTDNKKYNGGLGFQVAQYRKPEFLVNVTTDKAEVTQGATIKATVESQFYFGGAVSNAKVKWDLLSANYFYNYQGQGNYDFSDFDYTAGSDSESYGVFGETIASGEGVTDSAGKLLINIPADLGKRTMSQKFTLEATVTDINNQEVSGRTEITVHKGDFYLGVAPQKYVTNAGEDAAFNIIALDQQGKPRVGQRVSVSFLKHEWLNVQEQDEFGNNIWTWKPKDTLVTSVDVTTNAQGQATASFKPDAGGTYKAVVSGLDSGGRQINSAGYIWVTSRNFVSWRQDNNNRIQLVADKKLYKAGDTASILIPSPFDGEAKALVTVERGGLLKTEVITLDSNSYLYRLPILPEFSPNAFLSVVIVKGTDAKNPAPAFRAGLVKINVSNQEQELKVTLTPDKPKAGPRDTVTYKVKTTNYAGSPIKAEVSLGLVDLAVLALAEPNSEKILDTFYGQRGLGVRTSVGLTLSIDDLNAQTAKIKGGGGGGGGGFLEVRGDFKDTAFWKADVTTDDKGEASVAIKLPDNLTTWRLDVRGVSAENTLVGQNTVDIVATKDLLIRPVTPRFFVVGDEAKLAAIVNNNTEKDLSVDVTISGKGFTLATGSNQKQTVSVKAKDRTRVEWAVTASDAVAADITFTVVSGNLQDASKPTLGTPPDQTIPILKYIAPETAGTSGQLDGQASITELIALPRRYEATQGQLSITVAPSLAASMTDGLKYLEHYQYECTEQTISRFLPNVLSFSALKKLGVNDAALEASLKTQVNVGAQKLYAGQHADGGWGWWTTDRSDPYITSYVVFGLNRSKQAGFDVDATVLKRGSDYLKKQIANPNQVKTTWELNRQAFLLYTLADADDKSVTSSISNLYEARGRLDTYARSYLAMAIAKLDAKDSRIATLLSDINNTAITSATGVHWEENGRDWWNMNSDTRSTAIVLSVMSQLDPQNKLNVNIVRWLMSARKAQGGWETTQETAWSLIGLTDYMVSTGELKASYNYNVLINDNKLGGGKADDSNYRQKIDLQVKIADMFKDQANRIIFDRGAGSGKMYYSAYLTVYQNVKDIKALNKGVIVARQYFAQDGKCGTKGNAACPQVTGANVGQDVTVKVTVIAPNDLYHVVVEDPFPAGMEPIDTSLRTTSVVGKAPTLKSDDPLYYGWGWWWFSKTDIRDNKIMMSASYLPKGTYVYTYSLHASLAGTYQVIPTTASEFYFPDVMGRGEGMVFTIK